MIARDYYKPTVWRDNDAITAAGLNNIENGVAGVDEVSRAAIHAATDALTTANANAEDVATLMDEMDELKRVLNELAN